MTTGETTGGGVGTPEPMAGLAGGGETGTTIVRLGHRLLPILGAFLSVCLAIFLLGENPFTTLWYMVSGALGSQYELSETLMVMTPLILCGLAAAIPFSARLWNIGGDGQLYIGSVIAVVIGLELGGRVSGPVLAGLCVVGGIVAGSFWAILAALVKIGVDGNEVIVTIMLNLLAALAVDYVVTGPYAQGIAPQTKTIPKGATFGSFWQSGFNQSIFIAVAVAAMAAVFMQRTRAGFGIRAAGLNLDAARLAGVAVKRWWFAAFGEQYGYTGIAVALLAGLRPLLLIPSAAFFAIIEVGGNGLSASAGISPSIAYVIEAVIVISLLAFRVLRVRT
jgi:ABC-type uncharacterized transport system permease subunit